MRITSQMITRNALNNINRNKNHLSKLDAMYSSGKKIQRPSEDPIIAVRALKLRTNLSELNQYYEKNIPDAKHWMEVTQTAMDNINKSLTDINTACVQGANDPLNVADRTSIIKNLEEYKKQIYQEGNSNYAGRYVFAGYKTDTSLIFNSNSSNLQYRITEEFTGKNIESISKVKNSYGLNEYDPTNPDPDDFKDAPTLTNTHRIQLSYDNLDDTFVSGVTYEGKDALGNPTSGTITFTKQSSIDADTYEPGDNEAFYVPETGELILGKNAYESLRLADKIMVSYDKSSFSEGDLRPEHYFDCTVTDTDTSTTKVYEKSDQQIQYEINFNQKLTVNTQGRDALVHGIARDIDEIMKAAADLTETENKITEVKKMLEDKNTAADPDKTATLNKLLEQLETEKVLKGKLLQDKCEQGIASFTKHQDTVNQASADLASRYVRLEMTENRLSTQQVDFEELMSMNEDADVVDTYIRLTAAETIYTASLSSAAKVVRNTLLDFI